MENIVSADEFFGSAPVQEYEPQVSTPSKSPERKHGMVWRSVRRKVIAVGAIGAVVAAGAKYAIDYSAFLAPHVTSEGEVLAPGKASVQSVSFEMPPVTLSTAETKVTGVKTGFHQNLNALGGIVDIDFNQASLTREALFETLIRLDAGKVELSYNALEEDLTVTVPDGALSTEVNIPAGKASTVDTSGSLTALPAEMLSALTNAVAGQFGANASEVPLLGGVAKGTLSVDDALTKLADLYIVTEGDKQCTPLIAEIPSFDKELEKNIRSVAGGVLLDPQTDDEKVAAEGLSLLMDKPASEVRQIVADATIEMPDDYKIGPDEDNVKELKKYQKSGFFTTEATKGKSIDCAVSKDVTLTPVDEG